MAEIIPNRVPCGKRPEPQPTPTPKPEPAVVLCELSGVTYFKLRSDIPGDYTKNCGLLGDEIDKNFYFLRSMDILSAHTVNEGGRKYLVLERINCGRDIKVDITDEDSYDHNFRVQDGYIYVRYPGGEEDPIRDGNGQIGDGNPVKFLMEGEHTRVVTDASINGDGLFKSPLSLDLAYRTGTYMPADFYADLTCPEATLDSLPSIGHGHAVVTKENASRFGALYTYGQAKRINEALAKEGRGWRLPSKEDWAKLLNWAEKEDMYRDHDTDRSGNFGCVAGARLKTTTLWDGNRNDDDFDFSIYPVGMCPENYNTREPEDYGFTGLYKVSAFWTSSEKEGEIYTRRFSYGHDDVYQGTESPACRLSIRLVRDIVDDFDLAESAEILGNYVPTVLTTDGKQQWTSLNINFTNYEGYKASEVTVPEAWKNVDTQEDARQYYELVFNGDCYSYEKIDEWLIPSDADPKRVDDIPINPDPAVDPFIYVEYIIHIDMVTEPKFYFNAWDGNRWHKKMMREGESVVLINEDYETGCDTAATPYVTADNKNHEWRVFLNPQTGIDELIDTAEAIKREIERELEEIREAVSGLTNDLMILSGFVADAYDEMQSGFTSAFTAIDDAQMRIDEEISARTAADEDLQEQIYEEISARTAADEELLAMIEEEISARTEADEELWDALNEEISARTEADEELWSAITQEIADRIAADEELQEQIDELKARTIEPLDESIVVEVSGNTTSIGVKIDPEDSHIKIGDNGIFFDGDFGLI